MSKPRTGAPKRVAVGLLAGALAMFGVALAPPAGAAATVTTDRLAGATRYGTAAAIAGSSTFTAPTTAIVATGENFPDALAASSLAGANAQAPIILTETNAYTAEAKAGLAALKAKGVTAITLVGGTAAIAQSVEDAIKADGFTVSRVAGDDRYETAAAIATAANTKSAAAAIGGLKSALIATGTNFPDALAGGPAAYANKLPLLLVSDTVPAETANAISTLGIKKVYILGGTSAVSSTVEAQLVAATGNPATRLAGTNRYSTATGIADFEKTTLAFPITSALLSTGENFPDALAAGPLGGQRKAPAILTASAALSPEAASWLDGNSSTLSSITAVGGTAAVADTVLAAAKTSAQTVGNDAAGKAVTTRPELVGAQILVTTTALQQTPSTPSGTTVRFTFDEAIGAGFGLDGTKFHVYDASFGPIGSNVQQSGITNGAVLETGTGTTGTTVVVNFPGVASAAAAASLTKATVDFGAIKDAGGAENPEGAAPIGTAGTTTPSAGATSAPDLRSVGGYRQAASAGFTAVDFTFDQAAFVATAAGFHLVSPTGVDTACTASTDATVPSGGTSAGGSGTTVITAICGNPGGSTTTLQSTGTVARAYVGQTAAQGGSDPDAGGVVTAALGGVSPAPLEAVDVSGNSVGPDLTGISVVTASTGNDTATYTFDLPIISATGSAFRLYTTTGAELTPSGGGVCTIGNAAADAIATTGCAINSANPNQVLVRFTAATTSSVVGGNIIVGSGAPTTSGVTANNGLGNFPDEEPTAAAASTTVTPGKVAGPDLSSVALSTANDAFGNPTAYKATYTFDSTVSSVSLAASKFFLYFADGTRWVATTSSCVTSTTATTTVTCTTYTNAISGASPVTTALSASVLGSVDDNAVYSAAAQAGSTNTEDAAATTGGTGTAAS